MPSKPFQSGQLGFLNKQPPPAAWWISRGSEVSSGHPDWGISGWSKAGRSPGVSRPSSQRERPVKCLITRGTAAP